MQRFKNILFYVGENPSGSNALSETVDLVKTNEARLTLMDVVSPPRHTLHFFGDHSDEEQWLAQAAEEHRQNLRKLADELAESGVTAEVCVATGKTAVEIVYQVIRGEHDLIVKEAAGNFPGGPALGTVAQQLIRTAPCPVWILKAGKQPSYRHVMAAIDVDDDDPVHRQLNREILESSLVLAKNKSVPLHIVSSWDLWMESSMRRRSGDEVVDQWLQQREATVRNAINSLLEEENLSHDDVHIHVARGVPAKVIDHLSKVHGADLLVMGTVCRTGISGFVIGNTAETLITTANYSILALKPQGFQSPIHLPPHEA